MTTTIDKLYIVPNDRPVLHSLSNRVDVTTLDTNLISKMFQIMRSNHGIGLAAPQLGVSLNLFVMEYASICEVFINPVIIKTPGKMVNSIDEGCLSYPGLKKTVQRHKRVIVEYENECGEQKRLDVRGLAAFCIQHEIDHLFGITIGD